MFKRFLQIIMVCLLSFQLANAQGFALVPRSTTKFIKMKRAFSFQKKKRNDAHHSKVVAAGLNISLGLFGVHRLYLGTSPQVPVIYALSLGGGGFLMLSDLGAIIFTKDIEKYTNNTKVIMWSSSEKEE